MAWIFVTALRISDTDRALFYPKYAFIVFCAVLAVRVSLVTWRERGSIAGLVLGMLWMLPAAFLILAPIFLFYFNWLRLGMVVLGVGLAMIPVRRSALMPWFQAVQLLGIIALLGCLFLMMTGWLP